MAWVKTIERVEEKNALEKLRVYDISYQEDSKKFPWSITKDGKYLSRKDHEELYDLLDKYGDKLDKNDYRIIRLQRHGVLIFPGTGLAKLPKILNNGWKLVRGIKTVTTIGSLTPIGNAPSLASDKSLNDILDGASDGTPTKGKTKQYDKAGDIEDALNDFDDLELTNVRERSGEYGKVKIGDLPDGRVVIVREGSKEGSPTIEIQHKNGRRIKIRYRK